MRKAVKGQWSQPAYEPTKENRRTVKTMTSYGITQGDICAVLQISRPTLHRHYRRELDTASPIANAAVARALFVSATKDKNVTAMIWWTKARMGWSDKTEVKHSGDDQLLHLVAVQQVSLELAAERREPPMIEADVAGEMDIPTE